MRSHNEYLSTAVMLDPLFPPALCMLLVPVSIILEAQEIAALNSAFEDGFAYAGYR